MFSKSMTGDIDPEDKHAESEIGTGIVDARNTSLIVVCRVIDGIGDLKHLYGAISSINKHYPNTALTLIVSIHPENPTAYRHFLRYCQQAPKKNVRKIFLIRAAALATQQTEDVLDAQLVNIFLDFRPLGKQTDFIAIRDNALGFITVSQTPYALQDCYYGLGWWADNIKNSGHSVLGAAECGIKYHVIKDYVTYPMGFSEKGCGLRLIKDWGRDLQEDSQIEKLFQLTDKNLLSTLLRTSSISEITRDMVANYLRTCRFSPGFMHTVKDAAFYVSTLIHSIDPDAEETPAFDFYLPAKILENDEFMDFVTYLMRSYRIPQRDYAFMRDEDQKQTADTPIRFISASGNLSDEDYRALYYCARGISAYGGDDTMAIAFSSGALPFPANLGVHTFKLQTLYELVLVLKTMSQRFPLLKGYFEMFLAERELEIRSHTFHCAAYNPDQLFIHRACDPRSRRHSITLEECHKDFTSTGRHAESRIAFREIRIAFMNALANDLGQFYQRNRQGLLDEWPLFRKHIYMHHDFAERFPALLSEHLPKLTGQTTASQSMTPHAPIKPS